MGDSVAISEQGEINEKLDIRDVVAESASVGLRLGFKQGNFKTGALWAF